MSARAYAPPTSRMLLVVENFAMGACYYGLGKLALLLAIPPGYASAIWPPAGLALAAMLAFRYRVWPGIFVGHFLVNLFPSFEASVALPFMKAMSLALSIAAGGTQQAALGAFLIRRFVGYPNRLDKEKDVIFFLLLGGPSVVWSARLSARRVCSSLEWSPQRNIRSTCLPGGSGTLSA
jgi:integral membrane sensor domain MASE1